MVLFYFLPELQKSKDLKRCHINRNWLILADNKSLSFIYYIDISA